MIITCSLSGCEKAVQAKTKCLLFDEIFPFFKRKYALPWHVMRYSDPQQKSLQAQKFSASSLLEDCLSLVPLTTVCCLYSINFLKQMNLVENNPKYIWQAQNYLVSWLYKMTMKYLFTEVHRFYVSSKELPKYQNRVLFDIIVVLSLYIYIRPPQI